jgi:hypothetical protein
VVTIIAFVKSQNYKAKAILVNVNLFNFKKEIFKDVTGFLRRIEAGLWVQFSGRALA